MNARKTFIISAVFVSGLIILWAVVFKWTGAWFLFLIVLVSNPPGALGRANLVVYNWSQQDTIPVALSDVLRRGDRYAVYNVQDFFGTPVVGGVYAGEAVRIPMRGVAPPAPIGGAPQPPHSQLL